MDTYDEVIAENKIKLTFLEQQDRLNNAQINALKRDFDLVGFQIEKLKHSRKCDYVELDKLHQKEEKIRSEIARLSQHIFSTQLQFLEELEVVHQKSLDILLAQNALTEIDFYYKKGETKRATLDAQIKLIRARLFQLPAADKEGREILMQQEASLLKGKKISYPCARKM